MIDKCIKEKKYDVKTTVISTRSDNFTVDVPGEPATPPGGSGSTAGSNQGPGSSTPRSRNEAEKGGQQLP